MSLRSFTRLALLACCFTSLIGCIEYRFDRFVEEDRYIGWVTTKAHLDPKMGSKGKMHFGIPGPFQPYIGGHFSRRRLTMNVGVIYYLNDDASLEFGFRKQVFQTDNSNFGDTVGTVDWHDNDDDNVIYFGGKMVF